MAGQRYPRDIEFSAAYKFYMLEPCESDMGDLEADSVKPQVPFYVGSDVGCKVGRRKAGIEGGKEVKSPPIFPARTVSATRSRPPTFTVETRFAFQTFVNALDFNVFRVIEPLANYYIRFTKPGRNMKKLCPHQIEPHASTHSLAATNCPDDCLVSAA